MKTNSALHLLLSFVLMFVIALPAAADPVWRQFTPSVGHWLPAGEMNAKRSGSRAVELPNGEVLMIGGQFNYYDQTLNSTEIYDPETDSWRFSGNLKVARRGFTATALKDGSVLVAGGFNYSPDNFYRTATAERYDPATGVWQTVTPMSRARMGHVAVRLFSGKILVAGGVVLGARVTAPTASAELYDPKTNTWAATGELNLARESAAINRLYDGRVLITGGRSPDGVTNTAEIYDEASGTWQYVQNMSEPRAGHKTARLRSGHILVAGGSNYLALEGKPLPRNLLTYQGCCVEDNLGTSDWGPAWDRTAGVERFDPSTNTWIADNPMHTPRYGHSLVLLENGHVLAAGGCCYWYLQDNSNDEDYEFGEYRQEELSQAETYNPYTGIWSNVDAMPEWRQGYSALRLRNGNVLVFGGANSARGFNMALSSSRQFVLEQPGSP